VYDLFKIKISNKIHYYDEQELHKDFFYIDAWSHRNTYSGPIGGFDVLVIKYEKFLKYLDSDFEMLKPLLNENNEFHCYSYREYFGLFKNKKVKKAIIFVLDTDHAEKIIQKIEDILRREENKLREMKISQVNKIKIQYQKSIGDAFRSENYKKFEQFKKETKLSNDLNNIIKSYLSM